MPTVRTTFRPDLDIEVGDTECAQLKTEGLLVEAPAPADTPAVVPAAPVKKTISGTTGSKES